jgi:hypothetical protein
MSQVAVSNLPLPDDCLSIIKEYVYLDKKTYHTMLVKKSVNLLMKHACSSYTFDILGYPVICSKYIFRWYPSHIQHQFSFCNTCGNYRYIEFGELNNRIICTCL